MEFEWDEAKAASNLLKHGVRFDQAIDAFADPDALEVIDARADYGEERVILIGQATPGVLLVRLHGARRENPDHLGTKGQQA